METLFVDVILPLHLRDTYTYRVPQEYNDSVQVGQRVVVQFGRQKLYSAVIRRIHDKVPDYKVKYILAILDETPMIEERHLQLWEWIASYYMCYIGDVMAIALPSAFRLASESALAIHPDFTGELTDLTRNEMRIIELLTETPVMTVQNIAQALEIKTIMPLVHTMIEKHIIVMDEDLRERFKPRKVQWISLAEQYQDEAVAKELFDSLEKRKTTLKQLDVLLKFMQLSNFGKEAILKKQLTDCIDGQMSSLNTLIKNGILIQEERVASRLETYERTTTPDTIALNEEQQKAFEALSTNTQSVSLLHGVTSSGKTEVYIKLIQKTLEQGKQVLFLLPEIALTAQLINRLRRFFGNEVGVYHSRFSPSQRAQVWQRAHNQDGYKILLGARSALFLPFRNLGLVIVDEEHDPSYKQYEPAPRYGGRDTAIYLAHLWNAKTVLGSATPSIESYFNVKNGKYGFAEMKHRFGGLQMPEVLCVDMKEATKKKEVNGYFSKFLIDHIQEALNNHEQVILFQNRRGFSPRIECNDCNWTPQCVNCDVSLVYHKATNSLRCHYCGYSIPVPTECPQCHSRHLSMKGFGTERIEEDLSIHFPNARVARMDFDSTRQQNHYTELINDFEDRKIDILVGTQMVTKGLDFDNVSVVGILSADNLIYFPDFRAFERAFQQMMQVSGRAGRHGHQGKVIIQTYNPWHQAIRNVIDNDYQEMYNSQVTERRVFRYPPYYRFIDITLRHKDEERLNEGAATLATQLRSVFGNRVMGPEYPSIKRVRGLYIKKIMIRFERTEPVAEAKNIILDMADKLTLDKTFASLSIHFDVDPQ